MEYKELGTLWEEVVDIWNHGFMGVDIGQILIALGILVLFFILRGVFSRFVVARLKGALSRTKTKTDDYVIEALDKPLHFVPIVMGIFFAGQALDMTPAMEEFFGRAIRSLIVFTMFWGLHRALAPLLYMSRALERIMTPSMLQWMFKFLRVAVILLGAAIILELWGIQVGPLLAGLGLFGVAVAMGAQDVFKNLIAGITIIAERRFNPGDWIKVDGVIEGTVEDIGFRSTCVRRFDKAPVHVPNAKLSDVAVTNFSRMTHRRIFWTIGVEYRTTTDQLKIIRDGILDYIEKNEAFAPASEAATFVRIDSFNNSSIDIMVYCFTKTCDWGEWLQIKEELAFHIKDVVENKAGTGFAFPSQSVYVEKWPEAEGTPEVFQVPDKK